MKVENTQEQNNEVEIDNTTIEETTVEVEDTDTQTEETIEETEVETENDEFVAVENDTTITVESDENTAVVEGEIDHFEAEGDTSEEAEEKLDEEIETKETIDEVDKAIALEELDEKANEEETKEELAQEVFEAEEIVYANEDDVRALRDQIEKMKQDELAREKTSKNWLIALTIFCVLLAAAMIGAVVWHNIQMEPTIDDYEEYILEQQQQKKIERGEEIVYAEPVYENNGNNIYIEDIYPDE